VAHNRLQYLTPNDWTLIASRAQKRAFTLGEEIIREGSLSHKIYIIRSGEAAVELAGARSRALIATLGPDDICGDMSFLEQGQATAAVVTKSAELEADELSWEDLREVFEAFPRLASRFYQSLAVVLARRLRDTSRELAREIATTERLRKS
jgi:CRP-like cAMP-binding protein